MIAQIGLNDLWRQWLELWQRPSGPQQGGEQIARRVFDDLVARYSEPHRAYHTLVHIAECLKAFNAVRPSLNVGDERNLELALWYHDAVYDPQREDNEERSAKLVNTVLSVALNFSRSWEFILQRVADLVLMTKYHIVPVDDPLGQLLVDIDLSIFGQPENRFDEYERQIRKEYEWVLWPQFASGRAKVLRLFLDRPHIFSTEFFRGLYEEQARRNLARSLRVFEEAQAK